jgi:hypothetical protein
MTAYRMWQRNPDANSIYAPKAWSVRGVLDGVTYDANDSSTYTEIDLQTNQFFLQTDGDSLNYNTNFNHYMTNNTTAFKKYVWRFTEGHNANDIGFGEMELYDIHNVDTGINNQFTITCAVRPHNKSANYGTIFDVTFKIDKAENDTVFLRVDAMDSGSICACKVRLKCTGNCSDENDFCVKLKPLLEILRPLPGNEGIQLFRKKGKSDVELKTLGCESHHYKLRTLQDSYYREALESCETTYSVDFDLAKLKSHLRVITNLKADTLKIQIFKLLATNSLIFKLISLVLQMAPVL